MLTVVDESELTHGEVELPWMGDVVVSRLPAAELDSSLGDGSTGEVGPAVSETPKPLQPIWRHGWPMPSSICGQPDEARACIYLPEFDAAVVEKAQVISGRFPLAGGEVRSLRAKESTGGAAEIPHFEKVFRVAARLAGISRVQETRDYDELLILTAWHCVRPGVEGFLGSYP